MNAPIVIHSMLSIALLYTCFCRAVKLDNSIKTEILVAFWFLGIASVVSLFAPLAWGWKPDIVSMLLLFGIVSVQIVTSTHWNDGVPAQFKKPEF